MTIQINIAQAKAKLSALIDAAERGEKVVIARNGEPVAVIQSIRAAMPRSPGLLRRLGWTGPPTPIEAFAPDPEDAASLEKPLPPVVPADH